MTFHSVSSLPAQVEAVVTRVIGCAIEVHRRLGPGFMEAVYEDAMTIELELAGLRFERQREIVITYRDRPLRTQRIDLIVENAVVVELKAVDTLLPVHSAQLLSYLRATGLRAGLLFNFDSDVLKNSMKRVVL